MKKQMHLGLGLSLSVATAILVFSHASRTRAMVTDVAETPADARATFGAQCAGCHGRDGRGRTPRGRRAHARDLTDASWQNDVTDERLFNSINKGKGKKMPAYGNKLSEDQIDALVQYVRRLRR